MSQKEVVIFLYNNYKVRLSGGEKPRIIITLDKVDRPQEYFFKELFEGSYKLELKFSNDSMFEDQEDKLSIVVSIQAEPTEEILKNIGIQDKNLEEVLCVCPISSRHNRNVVIPFLKTCENIIKNNGSIPINIVNSQGKVLYIFQAKEKENFSWKEAWSEINKQSQVYGSTTFN